MFVNSILRRSLWSLCLCAFLAAATTEPAFGDSPAELLEKAIYLEETVGNLDEAIEGYEKVMAASKNSIDAAAEAQFRIASCFSKQGKSKEANAAFQAVIDSHGKAAEWVAKAKIRLAEDAKLLPVPWGDGDEMHLRMKLAGGLDAGSQIFRVAKTKIDGKEYWECQNWLNVTLSHTIGKSRVLADFDSFAPVESEWNINLLGEATAKYSGTEVAVTLAGKDEPKILTLDPMTFDNEQAAEVFRRLPLAKGYEGKISVIGSLTQAKVPIGLKVTELETIEVPAGKFECFKLELNIGQTFWISTGDKREIVRFEGSGVEANLVEVRKAGAAATTIDREKFSLTLPVGWYSFDSDDVTFLLDPDNSMRSRVVHLTIDADKKKFDSPQAWLKSKIGKIKKVHKNASAGESSIKTISVADHKAAVLDFEFDGDKIRKHGRRFIVFGPKTAFDVEFLMPADEKDKLLPEIQKLVDSLKLK